MTQENETRNPMRTTAVVRLRRGTLHRRTQSPGLSPKASAALGPGHGPDRADLVGVATAAQTGSPYAPQRRALAVRPISFMTSRSADADELAVVGRHSDPAGCGARAGPHRERAQRAQEGGGFPVEFAKPIGIRNAGDVAKIEGLENADVTIVYAAAGTPSRPSPTQQEHDLFCRHKSGPVYCGMRSSVPLSAAAHRCLKVRASTTAT